jgi:methyltransferase (TIGR00027 family)
MDPNRASVTALVTAFSRAWHAENDRPPVFDDSVAGRLLTGGERSFLAQSLAGLVGLLAPEQAAGCADQRSAIAAVMRVHAPISLCRSRYAEDSLAASVAGQYVILGAGFDTFALRRPDLLERLRVFEVDHPATQAFKRARLAELDLSLPDRTVLVPADFTRDDLAGALSRSPFDPRVVTFFSWLGVTYYLPQAAVWETLRGIARVAAPGSRVVMDCMDPDAFAPGRASPRMLRMQEMVRRSGEPMQTGLDLDQLPALLAGAGFRMHERLSPADIERRYFAGRADGYHAFEHVHLLTIERV